MDNNDVPTNDGGPDWPGFLQGVVSGLASNNPATWAVNSGGSMWNLAKAAGGAGAHAAGLISTEQLPEMTDMSKVPLSSEWMRAKMETNPEGKSGFWGNVVGGIGPQAITGLAKGASKMIAGPLAKNAPPRAQMIQGEDLIPKWEFNDQYATMKRPLRANEEIPLSSILNHDELYANYPMVGRNVQVKTYGGEFADQKTAKGDYLHKGAMGWDEDTGKATVYLNPNIPPDQQREVMLHELQHYIQNVEGMSDIANTKGLQALKTDVMDWLGKYGALKARDPEKAKAFAEDIRAKYGIPESMLAASTEAGPSSLKQLSGQVYWRQPAEIEARLTQKRRDMSHFQRQQEPFQAAPQEAPLDWAAMKQQFHDLGLD